MADDNTPPLPTIVALPTPLPRGETEAERDARVFGEAAVRTDQLRRKIEAAGQRESELSERCESLQKKVDFLELENAEYRNTIQTLESDKYNKDQVLSKLRQCLDALDVKSPPKKIRNGKIKDNGNQVEG